MHAFRSAGALSQSISPRKATCLVPGWPGSGRQERGHLGGEHEAPALEAEVEGFYSEWIARGEERLIGGVPQGEGEHSSQPPKGALAPLRKGGEPHLRG